MNKSNTNKQRNREKNGTSKQETINQQSTLLLTETHPLNLTGMDFVITSQK